MMPTIGMAQPEMITAEEAATLLGVLPVTVYRWCRAGRLRCEKPGKHWRIPRAEVLRIVHGAAPAVTLVEHLDAFLTMPDHVLVIAEDMESLRQADAAIFAVGASSDAHLVKVFNPAQLSRHAHRAAYRRHGFAVERLEAAGRFDWLDAPDPCSAVTQIRAVLAAHADRPTWTIFDWVGPAEAAAALEHLQALQHLTAAHPLVVAVGVVEPEPTHWPPLEQQWQVMTAIRGMIRLGQAGLVLSRVVPGPLG
jgi:excisionase family DNA binding protein